MKKIWRLKSLWMMSQIKTFLLYSSAGCLHFIYKFINDGVYYEIEHEEI